MICKNCKRLLPQQINYCNGCDAKVIRNRLTIRNLLEDFSYRYFNYENQFLRTFIHLFSNPQDVIGSYIDGTRKKYVNVISYFTIALTIFGLQLFIMNLFFKDAMDLSSFNKTMSVNMKNPEEFQKSQAEIQALIGNYQSLIYIVTIPVTAFATWIIFYITNVRKYNYTEHIVINLYYSAQVIIVTSLATLLLMVFGIGFYTISFIFTVLSVVYLAFVLKGMYALSFGQALLKVIMFIMIYLLLFVILMFASFVIAMLVKALVT